MREYLFGEHRDGILIDWQQQETSRTQLRRQKLFVVLMDQMILYDLELSVKFFITQADSRIQGQIFT